MDPASWLKAKDVILEAFERPAAEREAYVRQHCSDAVLRDKILSLLGASPTTPPTEHTCAVIRSPWSGRSSRATA